MITLRSELAVAGFLGLLVTSGCGVPLAHYGDGPLAVTSQDKSESSGSVNSGVYRFDEKNSITIVLFEGPAHQPAQAAIIRMFWRPQAASTPLDETATNATVQYIIFADGSLEPSPGGDEVGLYSGAGFVYPSTRPGRGRLVAGLWEATLRVTAASEGFEDRLGEAQLKGRFTAQRDDDAASRALRRLNVLVSERLGYPRLVKAG